MANDHAPKKSETEQCHLLTMMGLILLFLINESTLANQPSPVGLCQRLYILLNQTDVGWGALGATSDNSIFRARLQELLDLANSEGGSVASQIQGFVGRVKTPLRPEEITESWSRPVIINGQIALFQGDLFKNRNFVKSFHDSTLALDVRSRKAFNGDQPWIRWDSEKK